MLFLQMQVVILTFGIVAGRMGLEARVLHGQGNLVQLHHVTRGHRGITPQDPVREPLIFDMMQHVPSLQNWFNKTLHRCIRVHLIHCLTGIFVHPSLRDISLRCGFVMFSEAIIIYPFFTAGLYFYIEASGRAMGDVARLVSPQIQSNGNSTCMVFYYHLYGHSIGSLRVKVGDQVLWQLSGNQGNNWYKATVPLDFHGVNRVR